MKERSLNVRGWKLKGLDRGGERDSKVYDAAQVSG